MPLPTIGTYIEYVYPVCPNWPSRYEPNDPDHASLAQGYGGTQLNLSTCRWVHKEAELHTLPTAAAKAPTMIRITIGFPKTKEAQKHLQYIYCETHESFAKKLYLRESSWIEYVRTAVKQWWDFTHEAYTTPGGYKTWKLIAKRKNFIATMRKMW